MFGIVKTPESTPSEQAVAEIARLADLEITLLDQREQKRAELAQAEKAAGEAYLDGQTEGAVDVTLRLKTEVEALGRALDACHVRRLTAVEKQLAAKVAGLRQQAAGKRSKLATLESKTARLLAQLGELEGGIPYSRVILSAEPSPDGGYHTPRSATLRSEAEGFDKQAAELESRGIEDHGSIDCEGTVKDLIQAVLREERAVPTVQAIQEWVAAVRKAARKRGAGPLLDSPPVEFRRSPSGPAVTAGRRFRLVWRKGAIDREGSHMFLPAAGLKSQEHPATTRQEHEPDPNGGRIIQGPGKTVEVPGWVESWCDTSQSTFRAE